MLRLVLDTNIWLDWLMFDDPAVAPVKAAVAAGRAEIVMDQKFLELALACCAAFLVTRDGALLELARHKARPLPFRIVTPQQLAAVLCD